LILLTQQQSHQLGIAFGLVMELLYFTNSYSEFPSCINVGIEFSQLNYQLQMKVGNCFRARSSDWNERAQKSKQRAPSYATCAAHVPLQAA
jgi:hypothetical protein